MPRHRASFLKVFAFVGAVAATACASDGMSTEKAPAGISVGLAYAKARTKLKAAGWKPVVHSSSTAGERCGAREEICAAYAETEACSGAGLGLCVFAFQSAKGQLRVTTDGEELSDLAVRKWQFGK